MSAIISDCGMYRYRLDRGEPDTPYVCWILANPSTADASLDDPTVRKARGFTERWGYKRFVFVNVFAGRSTKPKGLLAMSNPVGPENSGHIIKAIANAEFCVLAWGNAIVPSLRHFAARTSLIVRANRDDEFIKCLGYTKDRQPRHPLMLAYSTPLEIYAP